VQLQIIPTLIGAPAGAAELDAPVDAPADEDALTGVPVALEELLLFELLPHAAISNAVSTTTMAAGSCPRYFTFILAPSLLPRRWAPQNQLPLGQLGGRLNQNTWM
jgi:hypothetical protein